ncbi:Uncharacterised protein [Rikenella microfusus]|uniref:Uncharacterized protein n=1 Tax=Rikenella microfusus TaxID=28139 RepID=A0A379MUH6_9BACT|nr:Uncharacterised protein [Rikenella microfusus]
MPFHRKQKKTRETGRFPKRRIAHSGTHLIHTQFYTTVLSSGFAPPRAARRKIPLLLPYPGISDMAGKPYIIILYCCDSYFANNATARSAGFPVVSGT